MTNDGLQKIVIVLIGISSGWLLAQITASVKSWHERRKIKKLLLEELKDIQVQLEGLLYFYARQLQIHGASGIGNEISVEISNPIYQNYYKEVILGLRRKQRISMQLIHGLVGLVNEELGALKCLTGEIHVLRVRESSSEDLIKNGEIWGNSVKVGYRSCATLEWTINRYLKFPKGLDLTPYTSESEEYLKYIAGIPGKVKKHIEHGKTLNPEIFDPAYNP